LSSLHKYVETCNGGKCCGDNVDKYLFKIENKWDSKSSKLIYLKRKRNMQDLDFSCYVNKNGSDEYNLN
jgi:hypothetical protein